MAEKLEEDGPETQLRALYVTELSKDPLEL
jgi:hypothetical protein